MAKCMGCLFQVNFCFRSWVWGVLCLNFASSTYYNNVNTTLGGSSCLVAGEICILSLGVLSLYRFNTTAIVLLGFVVCASRLNPKAHYFSYA